jgi:hypothetical protein
MSVQDWRGGWVAANEVHLDERLRGTLLQESALKERSSLHVNPKSGTCTAERKPSTLPTVVKPCPSAANKVLQARVWWARDRESKVCSVLTHLLCQLLHAPAHSFSGLSRFGRDTMAHPSRYPARRFATTQGPLPCTCSTLRLPCGALRWAARYSILIDGTEIAIVECNAYHYLSCARNGFDENHSVGAEHESSTSDIMLAGRD